MNREQETGCPILVAFLQQGGDFDFRFVEHKSQLLHFRSQKTQKKHRTPVLGCYWSNFLRSKNARVEISSMLSVSPETVFRNSPEVSSTVGARFEGNPRVEPILKSRSLRFSSGIFRVKVYLRMPSLVMTVL